jgi:hypothetical protein
VKISITVRVSGDRLDPEEITDILHVTPHVARRKGGMQISSSGKEIRSKFGFWTWKSEDITGTLTVNDHINRLRVVFEHAYISLGDLPQAENTWVDICIVRSVEEEGDAHVEFLLDAKSVAILHDIGLPVEFTIY